MKQTIHALVCALAMVALSAGVAQAAKISWSGYDTTTGVDWITSGGANPFQAGQYWDISSGSPDYTKDATWSPAKPDYLKSFQYVNQGGGSGGSNNGSGGGGGTTGINYNLVLNAGKTFDFLVLFYDSNYSTRNAGLSGTDVALQVRLIDPSAAPGTEDAWHDITVAQLEAGIYLNWKVEAAADEIVTTQVVWVNGDGVGAAGFFLDNVIDGVGGGNVPEPASVGLLLMGLSGLFMRRRK
jgi:hypothetical protein